MVQGGQRLASQPSLVVLLFVCYCMPDTRHYRNLLSDLDLIEESILIRWRLRRFGKGDWLALVAMHLTIAGWITPAIFSVIWKFPGEFPLREVSVAGGCFWAIVLFVNLKRFRTEDWRSIVRKMIRKYEAVDKASHRKILRDMSRFKDIEYPVRLWLRSERLAVRLAARRSMRQNKLTTN